MAPTRSRECTTLVALTLAVVMLGSWVVIPLFPFCTTNPGAAVGQGRLTWPLIAREAPASPVKGWRML